MPRTCPATLCRLAVAADPPTGDAHLLRAFLTSRSDSAFTELVQRHGPMVFAVCRRVLGHTQDAEDAFQAAFLVLARKAGSVRGTNLAGWLYGVAVRTARGVRIMRDRRRARDQESGIRNQKAASSDSGSLLTPDSCLLTTELATILDEELARLPEHYRLPVVLCELRGQSRKEAAVELGIPEGTLSSRLAKAKRKLAERLTDRGYTATAAALTAILATDAAARVPADWSLAAARAVTGVPTSTVAACAADGVVKTLFVAQLKGVALALGLIVVLATGGALVAGASGQIMTGKLTDGTKAGPPVTESPKPDEKPPEKGAKVWPRFKKIVGDDKESRALFAQLVADEPVLRVLEAVEANPKRAAAAYWAELDRQMTALRKWTDNAPAGSVPWAWAPEPGAFAGLLLLGTYSETAKVTYDEPGEWNRTMGPMVFRFGLIARKNHNEIPDPALRRLFAAWLDAREDDDLIQMGMAAGLIHDIAEVLPVARAAVKNKNLTPKVRGWAVLVLGQFGTAEDIAIASLLFDEKTEFEQVNTLPAVQVRDLAVAAAIRLSGKEPADLGFSTPRRGKETLKYHQWLGFKDDASRTAAHKKEWLDKQPKPDERPPEKGTKVWPRFKKIVGDDKESRALFDAIMSVPRNVEMLEAVENDPKLADKLYHDRWAELNKAGRDPLPNGGARLIGVPLADSAGWMFLGTYPGAEGSFHRSSALDFLVPSLSKHTKDAIPTALKEGPLSAPLRRLIGQWAERRTDYIGRDVGFQLAVLFDITEVLPAARATLVAVVKDDPYPGNTARNVALAMLVIGKFGTKDDLPLLARYADDETRCAVALNDPKTDGPRIFRPPIEGQDATTQLRDVSAAMRLHLRGQNPDTYGFYWRTAPDAKPKKPADLFELHSIGFLRNADRMAAHKTAKEYFDKQPKQPNEEPIRTFAAPAGIGAVAFDPKTGHLLTACADLSVLVWDAGTGKQIRTFRVGAEGSTGAFHGLVVAPDGQRIAARYFVADPTGKFLFGLEGHVAEITRIRYDRDGQRIATASFDGTVRLWEADTGKPLKTIEAHMGRKVAGPGNGFGPPPGMGGETGFRPTGSGSGPPPGPGGGRLPPPGFERFEGRGVWDVAFSPDGKRLVSGGVDGAIRVWDTDSGKEVWGGQVSEALMAVAYLPDGKHVVSGEQEGNIRVWDVNTGKEVKRLTGHTSAISALAVSPDGKRLVSASYDQTVRVWDVESGRELRCFRGHTSWIYAVAVSPDGRMIASGGEDHTVRLWAMP